MKEPTDCFGRDLQIGDTFLCAKNGLGLWKVEEIYSDFSLKCVEYNDILKSSQIIKKRIYSRDCRVKCTYEADDPIFEMIAAL